MIFPYLNGIFGIEKAPMTWGIFFLCVLTYIFSFSGSVKANKTYDELINDKLFRKTNGFIFANFIDENKTEYGLVMQKLSEGALEGNEDNLETLALLGIKDSLLASQFQVVTYTEDQVALDHWRKQMAKLRVAQLAHPSFNLGVTVNHNSPIQWITYQFAHSGFSHILSNMLFLLFFGSFLEPIIGSFAFLILYLASGVMGALVFLALSGPSLSPLVGASGSISGLLAFFAAIYGARAVRYVWLIGVGPNQFGFIYIPGWIVLVMWFVPDLAGYLSELKEMGGIAYTAHFGGELAGVLMGVFIYLVRYYGDKNWLDAFENGVRYKAFERTNGFQ